MFPTTTASSAPVVKTSSRFDLAVRNVVCVHSYDDYDYSEVNHLLERDLKLYIKAVACFPDSTKTPVCPLSWALLKNSERVRRF